MPTKAVPRIPERTGEVESARLVALMRLDQDGQNPARELVPWKNAWIPLRGALHDYPEGLRDSLHDAVLGLMAVEHLTPEQVRTLVAPAIHNLTMILEKL